MNKLKFKKILLTLSLSLLIGGVVSPAITASANEMSISEIDKKLKSTADEVAKIKESINKTLADIEKNQNDTKNTQAEIKELEKQIAEVEKYLEAELQAMQKKNNENKGIGFVFNSFFTKKDFSITQAIKSISNASTVAETTMEIQQKLENLKASKEESVKKLETQKENLDKYLKTFEGQSNELGNKQKELENQLMLAKTKEEESKQAKILEENRKKEEENRKKAQESQESTTQSNSEISSDSSVKNTGNVNLTYPISNIIVTSEFGGRTHPITGTTDGHLGIDLVDSTQASPPIKSAADGLVIAATYDNSRGNYAVVKHSENLFTVYMHMTGHNVSAGQTVKQGDVLGYMGSTGDSTGNHLHFEVQSVYMQVWHNPREFLSFP